MGDMGDMYRAWDEHKKERKAERWQQALDWLKENKVPYESKNNGSHFVLKITKERFDFWPTTGTLKIGTRYIANGLQHIQQTWRKINE